MGIITLCTSRTLLGILGAAFFLFGLACVGIGSLIIDRSSGAIDFVHNYNDMKVPAIFLIGVGLLFCLAGICGCCNLFGANRACLMAFFIFLFAVVILLIVSASLAAHYRNEIKSELQDDLNNTLFKYENFTEEIDAVQQHFHCCGINNSSDWLKTPFGKVPQSCRDNTTQIEFKEGCYTKLCQFFDNTFGYVVTGTLILLVILVLGMVGSCVLYRYKRDDNYFTLS